MRRHTLFRRIRCGISGPVTDTACGRTPFSCILAAASMLTLSACVNLAPAPQVPSPPVADAWPADSDTAPTPATGRALRDLDWANYFQDADMRRLIGLALEHNRDLRLAELRVREAEAAHRIQRTDLSPSISALGGIERSRVPGELNPTGQPQIQSRNQAVIGITHWEIDLWGRIRNLDDAALDDWLATDSAGQAVRVALVRQVADSVLVLRELDQRATLADEVAQLRYDSGAAPYLEVLDARRDLLTAQQQLVQVRCAWLSSQVALYAALGGGAGSAAPHSPAP